MHTFQKLNDERYYSVILLKQLYQLRYTKYIVIHTIYTTHLI